MWKSLGCWMQRKVMMLTETYTMSSSCRVTSKSGFVNSMGLKMKNTGIEIIKLQRWVSWPRGQLTQAAQKHSLHRAGRSSLGGEKRQTHCEGKQRLNSSIMSLERRSALVLSLLTMWQIPRSIPVLRSIPARARRTKLWMGSEAWSGL